MSICPRFMGHEIMTNNIHLSFVVFLLTINANHAISSTGWFYDFVIFLSQATTWRIR